MCVCTPLGTGGVKLRSESGGSSGGGGGVSGGVQRAAVIVDRYGCAVDVTAAAGSAPDVDQQHVCFLFQKVLLRRLDDVPGPDRDPAVHIEERRQRHRKHEVSFFLCVCVCVIKVASVLTLVLTVSPTC